MTTTATLALIAGLLALAAAVFAVLAIAKRHDESRKPTTWGDQENARQTFMKPSGLDVCAAVLMLASAALGFIAAAHG